MIIKWIRYLPSLVWMSLIFYLSHQPGNQSSETSHSLVDFVLNIIPISTEYDMIVHIFIRKLAHFTAYAILAALIYFAYTGRRAILFTLIVCLLFAITDEVHQLFIPGRSGEIKDVLIDISGAAFGLIVLKFIRKTWFRFHL